MTSETESIHPVTRIVDNDHCFEYHGYTYQVTGVDSGTPLEITLIDTPNMSAPVIAVQHQSNSGQPFSICLKTGGFTGKKAPKTETRKVGLNGWISFRGNLYQFPGIEHTTVDVTAYTIPYILRKAITVQYPSHSIPFSEIVIPKTLILKPAIKGEAI